MTGTPSVFVRTSGCNLRCWFCDTRFASWEPEGQFLSIEEIVGQAHKFALDHIVLTGGEPMIYNSITQLCSELTTGNRHLTIETAGTVFHEIQCNLMSISPKLSSSAPPRDGGSWHSTHNRRRERLDVVRRMLDEYEYQLKFVVDSPNDTDEVLDYLERLGTYRRDRVLIMPQGTKKEELDKQSQWILPWCQKQQFRFCPRSHIEWFGNRRGT